MLYKYVNPNTSRLILQNHCLRWSTPELLNDPYDIQCDLRLDFDHNVVKAAALEMLWNAFYGNEPSPAGNPLGYFVRAVREIIPRLSREEFGGEIGPTLDESLNALVRGLPRFHAETRAHMADLKILCVTDDPLNLLMWGYYSDGHKGIVLGFQDVDGVDSPWKLARPVIYVNEVPALYDDLFLAKLLSGQVSTDAKSIMDRLVYTKSVHHSHEREWRLCTGVGRDQRARFEDSRFNSRELTEIILGCRMNAADKTEIIKLARAHYPHSSILEARLDGREYRLTLSPME